MLDHIATEPGIYAIVNTRNGHRYVGQAKNMRARLQSHWRNLEKGAHRTAAERRLQTAWDEFGRDAFNFVVLEVVMDNSAATEYPACPDNLSLAEHFYIDQKSEYNVDKRIVRSEFQSLIDNQKWKENHGN